MLNRFKLIWFGIFYLLANSASAAQKTTEQLTLEIPVGWVKAVDKHVGELTVNEYFPEDTTADWQQKITIEALQTPELPDALHYAQAMVDQQEALCDEFSHNNIFSGFENQYPTVVKLIQCGRNRNTHRPLVTLSKVIQGNHKLYTITRIWRLAADQTPQELLNQPQFSAWANLLKDMQLCDPSLDAHPCTEKSRSDKTNPK